MDFLAVLEKVDAFLREREIPFLLIGGHAMASYGLPRTTIDLDLAVEGSAQDQVIRFVEELGYETLHRSSGFSNHLSQDPRLGQLDFIYVRGSTAKELFDQSRKGSGPGGLAVAVPRPEHLIAMKLHAIQNDPQRRFQDLADIRQLMGLPDVDRFKVREYFAQSDLLEMLDEFEQPS